MLTENEFTDFVNEIGFEIDMLSGKTNVLPVSSILNKIGFPDNWRDIRNI